MSTRYSDCAGRYAGCTDEPSPGRRMCENCREAHNAREAARRAERRAACKCTVCGKPAATVAGETLATCPEHREYFRARAAESR